MSLFSIAWLFWSVLFFAAPGSMPPSVAAIAISALYASALVYGRLIKATGCPKCASALPFLRHEIGRRHLRDEEHCIEVQYGAEEYGQCMLQVYCKVVHRDMVTYRCRRCDQAWEEKLDLPGSGYKLVRRIDLDK